MHTLATHEAEMPNCDDPDCEFHHPESDMRYVLRNAAARHEPDLYTEHDASLFPPIIRY